MMQSIKKALLSVSDKNGIVELASELSKLNVEIISTGGTYTTLKENGVEVTYISQITGFPEILDGRVKTLHPKIHGGILAKRNNPSHLEQLAVHGIPCIDLIAVNLYPFEKTVKKPNCDFESAIENIDIGGPTIIRAAAKNFMDVIVLTDPLDYQPVVSSIKADGCVSRRQRLALAIKAFKRVSAYDAVIYKYLEGQVK